MLRPQVLRETNNRKGFRLCIAGRSRHKLEAVRNAGQATTDVNAGHVFIEVVNVADAGAMAKLAGRTRVMTSCVGPVSYCGRELSCALYS